MDDPASVRATYERGVAAQQEISARLLAKTTRLEHLLARAYPFLTWPDAVRGRDPDLDAEFDGVVRDVEVAIQHLPDEKLYDELE